MEAATSIVMLKALDGLSMRAIVTSQNIANASTPNYRPLRVSFERALAEAARRGTDAVLDVEPRIDGAGSAAWGGRLRLDLEMESAAATALRYGALVEVLDRSLRLQSAAISGGR